jgi:tripartite-type tricarboxylate transporter receptor subunit TctC
MWAPKGTAMPIMTKLNGAVANALADPKVRQRLADLGQDIPGHDLQTLEGFAAFQKAEIDKWWPIIKAANIKGG